MTKQSNAELLAEADKLLAENQWTSGWGVESLAERLAAALEAADQQKCNALCRDVEQERDQYAAVVEKVRGRLYQPIHPYGDRRIPEVPEHEFLADGYGEALPRDLFDILATAPADALREHDAALIEALADEVRDLQIKDTEGFYDSQTYLWIREKARQRREERA